MGVAINAALGPIGWAVMALQALSMIFSAISKIHDNKRQQIIEAEKDKVERLEAAYENLYDTIEDAPTMSMFTDNSLLVDNLTRQIDSYRRMIAAEEDKKKTDWEQIEEWEGNIEDLSEQITELYDNLRNELVGSFKDAADELGSAIVDAYRQGEDAQKAWAESLDDIIADIVKNLMITRILEPELEKLMDDLYQQMSPKQTAAEDAADTLAQMIQDRNQLTYQDFQKRMLEQGNYKDAFGLPSQIAYKHYMENIDKLIQEQQKKLEELSKNAEGEVPNLTEEMVENFRNGVDSLYESFINSGLMDLIPQEAGEDNLTGLQRGIESITHEQSDALQALLESLRFFVSDENAVIHNIYNTLTMPTEENPFLAELRVQSEQLRLLYGLWNGVIKNVSGSGRAVNVRIV